MIPANLTSPVFGGTCGLAQLTIVGDAQGEKLGQFLRKRLTC